MGERVEPVEGGDRLGRDPGERVAPADVRELVEEDDAAAVRVPRGRGGREDEDGPEDAGGQRDLRAAREERDGACDPEGEAGLVGRRRPLGIAQRPRAPHEAAHGEEPGHEARQHHGGAERPEKRRGGEDVAPAREEEETRSAGASRRFLRRLCGGGLECRVPAPLTRPLPLFTF